MLETNKKVQDASNSFSLSFSNQENDSWFLERKTLDEIYKHLFQERQPVELTLQNLHFELNSIRQKLSTEEWEEFVKDVALQHPLKFILHQDPFTRRSFEKPRGYPGDAGLLDYIYRIAKPGDETTVLGKKIFDFNINSLSSEGLRARREFIAKKIDAVSAGSNEIEILTVAGGHLREASLSKTFKDKNFKRWIVLDQDPVSLKVVQNECSSQGIQTAQHSIEELFDDEVSSHLGRFDFIYSMGLYDYLPTLVAQKLTATLFSMLKAKGRLSVSNCKPTPPAVGYVESFMAWPLIFREPEEMRDLSVMIPETETLEQKGEAILNGGYSLLEVVRL